MQYAALGLLVFVLLLGLTWAFVRSNPATLARGLRIAAVGIGGSVALLFLVTGRLPLASLFLGVLLPFLMRWRQGMRWWRNSGGPTPGRNSEVRTRFLRMHLDHDTGDMTGVVLEGAHKGRHLSELAPDALMDLLRNCRAEDPQSASLLEAFLDRTAPDWRERWTDPAAAAPASGVLDRGEAYRLLGLKPGAGRDEIKRAHRELMQKVHPDRGGSTYLAAKINEAKDLLLRT